MRLRDSLDPSIVDYRTVIAEALRNGADSFYIPFLPGSIAPFLTQARELGFTGLIMTGDSLSEDEVALAGIAAEGLLVSNIYTGASTDLETLYIERYGVEPQDLPFVAFGYDGIQVLLEALEDRETTLADSLRNVELTGVAGLINLKGRQSAEKNERIYEVVDGTFEEVWR